MAKRKTSYISITVKEGNAIDYPEALKEQSNYDYDMGNKVIYILPPFNRFKGYIFLFPSDSIGTFCNNEAISHPHRNFVLYKNRWYEPRELFRKIPIKWENDPSIFRKIPIKHKSTFSTSDIFSILSYCDECLKVTAYKIPYSYFDLTSREQIEFKQEAIQPIRSLFSKLGFLTPDNRGKGPEMARQVKKEIHKVIVVAYKKAKRKRPLPIQFIQNELEKYLKAKFSDKPDLYDDFSSSDASIRRILKKEGMV